MKHLLHALLLLYLTATTALAQTGTPQTKSLLNTETTTNFPDNSSGLITPAITRQSLVDYIASWQQAPRINAQAGASYAVIVDDYGKLVTFNNSSPVAVTLPQATGSFATFNYFSCTTGAGTVTITPGTSTINGAATLVLPTGQCAFIVSDGTNYQALQTVNPAAVANLFPATTQTGPLNCGLTASVGSNLLTVTLTDQTGANPSAASPCVIPFRSSTATTGQMVTRSVTAALSINTNATGATLGSANNQAFRFWVVAFDNAGTVVLSLYNASSYVSPQRCLAPDETQVQSSTAISGAATATQTFYTPNGTTVTSKAIKIIGYVEYNSTGLVTAGTYATAPNFIQVMGSNTPRPCSIVQSRFTTNSTTFSTTNNGFIATNLLQAIVPTSAANAIYVQASGSLRSSVANQVPRAQVFRTSTAVGGICTTFNAGSGGEGGCSLMAMDFPNTATSVTYTLEVSADGTNTTTWGSGSNPTVLLLQEIMG